MYNSKLTGSWGAQGPKCRTVQQRQSNLKIGKSETVTLDLKRNVGERVKER